MRELAWRIFAGELNSSDLEYSEGGERAPTYLVSPLGAKINRLLAVGVLTELENLGDEREPLWKARISDPTGTFYITSGQYQMEASLALSKLSPPAFISVVGKSRVYSPEESVVYVSIRPEIIKEADSYIRDYWILEACESLKKRLEVAREASKLETPTKDKLMELGCRKYLADGIILASDHYKEVEFERYERMLVDALRYVLEEDLSPEEVGLAHKKSTSEKDGEGEEEGSEDKEDIILKIIENHDKDGGGASWDDVVSTTKKKGIKENELEELTNLMLEKGKIYEPLLGKIKKA